MNKRKFYRLAFVTPSINDYVVEYSGSYTSIKSLFDETSADSLYHTVLRCDEHGNIEKRLSLTEAKRVMKLEEL